MKIGWCDCLPIFTDLIIFVVRRLYLRLCVSISLEIHDLLQVCEVSLNPRFVLRVVCP